jgi:peptidoglycan hydrolase-like protein with peptidoglycan-binding domain
LKTNFLISASVGCLILALPVDSVNALTPTVALSGNNSPALEGERAPRVVPAAGEPGAAADVTNQGEAVRSGEAATTDGGFSAGGTEIAQLDALPIDAVQDALNRLGFDAGAVDGLFGARTQSAIIEFQEQNGLPATGEIDPATQDLLMRQARLQGGGALTQGELETLIARIALYPDDLVAAIVSASLYPLQIVHAARFLEQVATKPDLKPDAAWDGSIISLLNYPDVVKMMNDDLEWTERLGTATVNQQEELLAAIQQLRNQAVASGVLKSSEKVVVVEEQDNVVIQSSDPEIIYVPTYDPAMLIDPAYAAPTATVAAPAYYSDPYYYSAPYPSYYYPAAGFWAGAVTGAIWAGAIDWDGGDFWGGDVDIDRGDINIDRGDINIGEINRNNVNIDRDKLVQNIKANDGNRLRNQSQNRDLRQGLSNRPAQGRDVRRSVESGLRRESGGRQAAQQPRSRPAAQQPRNRQAAQQPRNRQAAQQPRQGKQRSKAANRSSGQRMASRPDNRARQASPMGNYRRGHDTRRASNRGNSSMGRHSRGGGGMSRSRGGGGRRR